MFFFPRSFHQNQEIQDKSKTRQQHNNTTRQKHNEMQDKSTTSDPKALEYTASQPLTDVEHKLEPPQQSASTSSSSPHSSSDSSDSSIFSLLRRIAKNYLFLSLAASSCLRFSTNNVIRFYQRKITIKSE